MNSLDEAQNSGSTEYPRRTVVFSPVPRRSKFGALHSFRRCERIARQRARQAVPPAMRNSFTGSHSRGSVRARLTMVSEFCNCLSGGQGRLVGETVDLPRTTKNNNKEYCKGFECFVL
jgi:hypothetical protein